MIESYSVGAVFRLQDEASPVMRQISERLTAIEKLIGRVSGAMKGIGDVKVGSLGAGLQGINDKLKSIGTNAEGIGAKIARGLQTGDEAIVDIGRRIQGVDSVLGGLGKAAEIGANGIVANFGRADTVIGATVHTAQTLSTELRAAATASREIGRLPGMSGGGGGGHVRPGSPSGGGDHGGGHGNAYGRHGVGVDAGIFGFMGYETVKSGIEATLHRGMELAHVQEQMRQAGFKDPDIDRATSAAWKESRTYGLDVSKTLGDIKELALPFGSVDHAIDFIEPLEKMRVVLNSVQEGRGNSSAEAVYKMARAGELKGLQNPDDFVSYFEGMTKAISASGGKVTPDSFMQATKYGKLSSFGLSEDFYTRSLPTMIQTMGASTAGQSLQSLFSTLSGSVSQKSFYKIQDLGLIDDPSKVVQTKTGIQMQPGAVKGYDEFVSNPLAWAKDILTPLLEKKFGDISDPKNKEAILGELQGMFGNRNSAAAIAELALRSKSFDKDAALIDQARGLGGANDLLKNDPTAAMNNFSAAWINLLTAMSGSAVKPATEAMNTVASSLNKVGEFMQAHPDVGKTMEGALAGLAVGLAALAAVGLAAFAPGGIVAVALVTLTSALAGMMAINWDKISADFKRLNDFGNQVGDAVVGFIHGIIDKVTSIPGFLSHGDPSMAPMTFPEKAWRTQHPGQEPPPGMFGGAVHKSSFDSFANDNFAKALGDLGTAGEKAGLIKIGFDGLDTGTTALKGRFGDLSGGSDTLGTRFADLGTGSGGLKTALDILAATAVGAARALAEIALGGTAGGASGSGSGIVNAAYTTWGDASSRADAAARSMPSIRYGRPHSSAAGGGWSPSASDPIFTGAKDASGFDWSRMGVQMGAKSAYLGNHLEGIGMPEFGAAAMLGHATAESNYKVDAHNPRLENSHGLFQWNDGVGRWSGLLRWAQANHRNVNDPLAQLDYAKVESMHMRGPGGHSVWDAMTHAHSLAEASKIWMDYFEAPKIRDYANRRALGEQALGAMRQYHDRVPKEAMPPPPLAPTVSAPPPRRSSPGVPASAGSGSAPMLSVRLEAPIHLDGEKIGHHVVHRMVAAMEHPTAIGGPDTYGSHQGPGTPLNDAA